MNEITAPVPAPATPPVPAPRLPAGLVFTPGHRELFGRLGRAMRIVAAGVIVFGLLQFLAAPMALVVVIQGLLMLLFGALTWNVGGRFGRIGESRGRDLAQLMEAVDGLRLLYTIQLWVLALAALAIVVIIAMVALR
ncbi:MAG TPA: hypothetical protein VFG21_06285 [Xanthomonadaceae bacterium]|nr:hypothetical protein [Xanthomonadaceae bacterium]